MDFTPKRVSEIEIFTVDFKRLLGVGETITSATWSVSVKSGIDPTPNAMVIGGATVTGSKVSNRLGGGIGYVEYWPVCEALTSQGQTLILPDPGTGALMVLPDVQADG